MKAGPTSHDRNTIYKMLARGESVQAMVSTTQVRRDQVEKVIANIRAGKLGGPKVLSEPVTAIAEANNEIARLQAKLDAIENKELTSGQKAAATRAANKASREAELKAANEAEAAE